MVGAQIGGASVSTRPVPFPVMAAGAVTARLARRSPSARFSWDWLRSRVLLNPTSLPNLAVAGD
jgi:hypothetical protein